MQDQRVGSSPTGKQAQVLGFPPSPAGGSVPSLQCAQVPGKPAGDAAGRSEMSLEKEECALWVGEVGLA